jgi:type IV pilus assembly protein PilV
MNRGYTVVEVMMALALLAVGATGVVAVQKATLAGNTQARTLVTANAIAESWAERLRAEALGWNAPNGVNDLANDTQWLKLAATTNPPWFNPAEILVNPTGSLPAGSPDADALGADIYPGGTAQPAFCTKMRLTLLQLFPNPSVNDPNTIRTIRAEIRVYWERSGIPVNCTALPDPQTGGSNRLGFVSLTTAVVQNTAPPSP